VHAGLPASRLDTESWKSLAMVGGIAAFVALVGLCIRFHSFRLPGNRQVDRTDRPRCHLIRDFVYAHRLGRPVGLAAVGALARSRSWERGRAVPSARMERELGAAERTGPSTRQSRACLALLTKSLAKCA